MVFGFGLSRPDVPDATRPKRKKARVSAGLSVSCCLSMPAHVGRGTTPTRSTMEIRYIRLQCLSRSTGEQRHEKYHAGNCQQFANACDVSHGIAAIRPTREDSDHEPLATRVNTRLLDQAGEIALLLPVR